MNKKNILNYLNIIYSIICFYNNSENDVSNNSVI